MATGWGLLDSGCMGDTSVVASNWSCMGLPLSAEHITICSKDGHVLLICFGTENVFQLLTDGDNIKGIQLLKLFYFPCIGTSSHRWPMMPCVCLFQLSERK